MQFAIVLAYCHIIIIVIMYHFFIFITGEIIGIQERLIEGHDQKPDDGFLQSFAGIIGNRWPSLASLLSLTAEDIEEIKTEREEHRPLCMLKKWSVKSEATYAQLHDKLQSVSLIDSV